jgi:hypothetical protein
MNIADQNSIIAQFGRIFMQCEGCLPAAGSGQPPSVPGVVRAKAGFILLQRKKASACGNALLLTDEFCLRERMQRIARAQRSQFAVFLVNAFFGLK